MYHGTVLRGDTCRITIGKGSIIQDNTILHNANHQTKSTAEIKIGDSVIIGVNCKINSCIIEDRAIIGNGATIHEGCHIESGVMIAAGAVLRPNTTVPANQVLIFLIRFGPETQQNTSETSRLQRRSTLQNIELNYKNLLQ